RPVEVVDPALERDGEVDEVGLAAAEQDELGGPHAPEPEEVERGEDERDGGCGGCPDRDPACDGAREAHARTLPASSVCPHTGRPVISDGCAGKPAHPEVGTASGA